MIYNQKLSRLRKAEPVRKWKITCGINPRLERFFVLTITVPESNSVRPAMTFNTVLFPHPLAPSKP